MVGHGVEHHHHAQVLPLLGHCDTPCERYDRRPHSLPVEGAYREFARRREGMSFALDGGVRSEEHTSELQSRPHLVCRLLLEKKKNLTQSPRSSDINSSCVTIAVPYSVCH